MHAGEGWVCSRTCAPALTLPLPVSKQSLCCPGTQTWLQQWVSKMLKCHKWQKLIISSQRVGKTPKPSGLQKKPPSTKISTWVQSVQKKHWGDRGADGNRSEWDQFYSQAFMSLRASCCMSKKFLFFPLKTSLAKISTVQMTAADNIFPFCARP